MHILQPTICKWHEEGGAKGMQPPPLPKKQNPVRRGYIPVISLQISLFLIESDLNAEQKGYKKKKLHDKRSHSLICSPLPLASSLDPRMKDCPVESTSHFPWTLQTLSSQTSLKICIFFLLIRVTYAQYKNFFKYRKIKRKTLNHPQWH